MMSALHTTYDSCCIHVLCNKTYCANDCFMLISVLHARSIVIAVVIARLWCPLVGVTLWCPLVGISLWCLLAVEVTL